MFKSSFLALTLTSIALMLGACGTPGRYAPQGMIGGAYLVAHYPGTPEIRDSHGNVIAEATDPDPWGPAQFQQIEYFDHECHDQLDPYIPSLLSDVGHLAIPMGIDTAIGSGLGTGIGAAASFPGAIFRQYAGYGAASGGGAALGSGVASAQVQHNVGVHYVQYACVYGFVGRAQQKGQLKGAVVTPWAGAGAARFQRMPEETVASRQAGPDRFSRHAPVSEQELGDQSPPPLPPQ